MFNHWGSTVVNYVTVIGTITSIVQYPPCIPGTCREEITFAPSGSKTKGLPQPLPYASTPGATVTVRPSLVREDLGSSQYPSLIARLDGDPKEIMTVSVVTSSDSVAKANSSSLSRRLAVALYSVLIMDLATSTGRPSLSITSPHDLRSSPHVPCIGERK